MENKKLMKAPKLSVIIPVYSVEKYIERCARSLFEQTLDDIEYLFIDDCTPDKSIEVLQRVLEDYPQRKEQVIIHRMERNSGQAFVRRWGMEHATGEYVIHCDSDDWVDKDMYRSLYEKAVSEKADVVLCGFLRSNGNEIVGKQESIFDDVADKKEELIKALILGKDLSSLCNKIVKRSLYQEEGFFYPQHNMWEDFVYSFQMYSLSRKTVSLNQYLYYYFQNESSICRDAKPEQVAKRFFQLKENVEEIERIACQYGDYDKLKDLFVALKFKAKSELDSLLNDQEYRKLWNESFKEINSHILTSPYISFRQKIKYMLILLQLYPR